METVSLKKNNIETITASITAEPLMCKELKAFTLYLGINKLTDKKIIYKKVIDDNIFQYKSPNSTLRRLSPLYKRYNSLSPELKNFLINSNYDDGSLVSLYAIYKTNLLFKLFFDNVIDCKFKNHDLIFTSKDVQVFLTSLQSEYEQVNKWTDQTRKKINDVLTKILKDSLILSSNGILQKRSTSNDLKGLINSDGGKQLIDIIQLN